ncbi:hypothetical protein EXIGLDRAFT_723780 [Exidia glandulosa HHB12029]|uniref:Uncharacterized protein n=1 Tax=Exidia glandulosa HHB12029 TaxID=1314781 RepID=A0A166A050_EXIGL|nr:hypothetical protein EXIGLDRAFT_723780 [Exidia glandulosa HHB12029]
MSLVVSTAFQISPYIQSRALTVLGILSHSDLDDDLLYQVLVALQKALRMGDKVEALHIVSTIRCLTNVVPGLPPSSRYLPQLFWIPVILLQTSDTIVFKESLRLLGAVVRTLQGHQLLAENDGLANYMLTTRDSFADVISQVEQMQGVNFDVSFTFSLTALIYRGIHVASMREAAQSTLRTLLRATTWSSPVHDEPRTSVDPDAVAYFIALLFCGTPTEEEAAELLHDAGLSVEQLPALPLRLRTRGRDGRLHLLRSTEMLGLTDKAKAALFAVSLVLMMEATSSPTLVQQVNIIQFLTDVGQSFAEYAMMACTYRLETLPGSLHDLLNHTSDPEVVQIVSRFSRMAMDTATRPRSSSTAGKTRVTLRSSLQEEGMAGLLEERLFTGELDAEVMERVDKVLGVILETPSSHPSGHSELISFGDF